MEKPSIDLSSASQRQRGCVAATAIIWGCATGMLSIDLLLKNADQTVVAVAIVAAAAVSTMTIWRSAGEISTSPTEKSESL